MLGELVPALPNLFEGRDNAFAERLRVLHVDLLKVAEDGVVELIEHHRHLTAIREVEIGLESEEDLAGLLGRVEPIFDAPHLDSRFCFIDGLDHPIIQHDHGPQRTDRL